MNPIKMNETKVLQLISIFTGKQTSYLVDRVVQPTQSVPLRTVCIRHPSSNKADSLLKTSALFLTQPQCDLLAGVLLQIQSCRHVGSAVLRENCSSISSAYRLRKIFMKDFDQRTCRYGVWYVVNRVLYMLSGTMMLRWRLFSFGTKALIQKVNYDVYQLLKQDHAVIRHQSGTNLR